MTWPSDRPTAGGDFRLRSGPISELTREDLLTDYLETLPFPPYPVQEDALVAWFSDNQGVMVCAPTGTGKTLIAEAAVYEALRRGRSMIYTTPLIALTDQKFHELRASVTRWGYGPESVGLVTGNRKINADAPILVVVAEVLFNRLLHPEAFAFDRVESVVMDEFHSFNDRERGIVWEFSLGMLPPKVRSLLLSATVGNAPAFVQWLRSRQNRRLELVASTDRKVPLHFQFVDDELLNDFVEQIATGDESSRRTPALLFCFNRDECWNVAEQLRGKGLVRDDQKAILNTLLADYDMTTGAGPKLKELLKRGVGIHHAGIMPKYRKIVEDLFQQKLLSVCVCTETLAAGINLPARSVVLPSIITGPRNKRRIIDPANAHQMFGRAGRPQFDKEGHVFILAHEDDVKIARWKEKYDQIPEDTKDPGLRKAKKALEKKKPRRREGETYWTEEQVEKLRNAPSPDLSSRGAIPWRLLAYMLDASPEVSVVRDLIGRRLLDTKRIEEGQKDLDRMLKVLNRAGYITVEPKPPLSWSAADLSQERTDTAVAGLSPWDQVATDLEGGEGGSPDSAPDDLAEQASPAKPEPARPRMLFGQTIAAEPDAASTSEPRSPSMTLGEQDPPYRPERAVPTERLPDLLQIKTCNPLYGVFLIHQLGIADRTERIQAMESVLELPSTVARLARVPWTEEFLHGPLQRERLNGQLLEAGLVSAEQLGMMGGSDEDDENPGFRPGVDEHGELVFPLTLADKLQLLFRFQFAQIHDVKVMPVWAAGEILEYQDFNRYITSKGLYRQEGQLFRHCLRMILLIDELTQIVPAETTADEWRGDLDDIANQLEVLCRRVDPQTTDQTLEERARTSDPLPNGS